MLLPWLYRVCKAKGVYAIELAACLALVAVLAAIGYGSFAEFPCPVTE